MTKDATERSVCCRSLVDVMMISANHLMRPRWHRLVLLMSIAGLATILYINSYEESSRSDRGHFQNGPDLLLRRLNAAQNIQEDARISNRTILVEEKLHHPFQLVGALLNERGVAEYINVDGQSGLIYSFSPEIEKAAKDRVVDPPRENIYYANSPAITWHKGNLVLIVRIWLARERYERKQNWPANHFADNFLFTQTFDKYLRPVTGGAFMGIPIPKQFWVGDGPIEPRVFKLGSKLLVSFNAAMALKRKQYVDWTTLWDFDESLPIMPKIRGGSPMMKALDRKDDIPRDKHWMAFTKGEELYFIHNLDPLRVMRCFLNSTCYFVHSEEASDGFIFQRHRSHLRGGTPLELYQWPYYIGFAHVTLYKKANHHRYYTANLIVFSADPYRLVFISDPIEIHPEIYRHTPMVRQKWIDDGFIFPVGVILEDPDTVVLGVHVNDYSSVLLRIRGIYNLMNKVMEQDKKLGTKRGPPPMFMHKYVQDRISKISHIEFEKKDESPKTKPKEPLIVE